MENTPPPPSAYRVKTKASDKARALRVYVYMGSKDRAADFVGHVAKRGIVLPSATRMDDIAKVDLIQFWELLTVIPCAPKDFKR